MAKVYMMCGKICSGKSSHAAELRKQHHAVVLSVDEITLALFGPDVGEKHDEYVEKAEQYLYEKSVEIIHEGINVVLDWGFWTKEERSYAKSYYSSKGIECEFHYIDISHQEWGRRIEKRNVEIKEGKSSAYYVDDGLAAKFESIFEIPAESEIAVWIRSASIIEP